MGGEDFVIRTTIAGLAMVLALATQARAEEAEVSLCKFVVERTAEYIRTGEMDKARRNKEHLQKCGPILKNALHQEGQKIVDDFDASPASSR